MKYSKDLNIRELIKTVVVPYEYIMDKENPLSWCGYFTVSPYQEWIWIDKELDKLSELELWKLYALCADHWGRSYEEWYNEAEAKVKEYKRLEEQGRLIKLPCKVGDRYYRIRKTCSHNWLEPKGKYFPSNHYCEDFCPRHHNGCDGEYIVVEYVFETIGQIISNQKWLGEYLFLSREEAEQKLKEMGE